MQIEKAKKNIISHLDLCSDPLVDGRLFFRERMAEMITDARLAMTALRAAQPVVLTVSQRLIPSRATRAEIPAYEFYEIALRVLAVFN